MIVKELIGSIRDLGFEQEDTMEEYEAIILNAVNMATDEINLTFPLLGRYEITNGGEYDLEALIADYDTLEYIDEKTETGIKRFNSYDKQRETIFIDPLLEGTFYVMYLKTYTAVNDFTDEVQVMPMCNQLLRLLCAYYVWKDDDAVKAFDYYNQYIDLRQRLSDKMALQNKKFNKAHIVGGIRI